MNLESLRRKRSSRLGVKSNGHAGQRRIYFVLDRATRKFHGDVGLWMQYLDYARKQKAFKKMSQILTSVLRLHPTKPELWIYAANYAMAEQGDMTEARSYMQRGLRFCNRSKELWIEYARLEMLYTAKIAARRKILGLDEIRQKREHSATDDPNADHIALPLITADDINPNLRLGNTVDQVVLENLSSTPALSGAIPIAVFSAAMEVFPEGQFGERFFNMFAGFENLPFLGNILDHISSHLLELAPKSSHAWCCRIRQPLIGVNPFSPSFPSALRAAFGRLKSSIDAVPLIAFERDIPNPRLALTQYIINWLFPYLEIPDLDANLRMVVMAMLRKTFEQYQLACQAKGEDYSDEVADTILEAQGRAGYRHPAALVSWAKQVWPLKSGLQAIE